MVNNATPRLTVKIQSITGNFQFGCLPKPTRVKKKLSMMKNICDAINNSELEDNVSGTILSIMKITPKLHTLLEKDNKNGSELKL